MGRNKRQARLAFNPLPTSSPTNTTAIKENGQRSYANVGYEGSQRRSKRRRTADKDVDNNEAEFALPTPVKSSQFPASSTSRPSRTSRISEIEVQDESEPRTTAGPSKTRRSRAAQGRLDFSNHIGVRLDDSEKEERRRSTTSSNSSDDSIMRTKTPARARPATGIFPTQRSRVTIQEESSEDELQSETHSTPRKSSPLKRLRRGRRAEDSEPRRSRRRTQNPPDDDDDDEEDDAPVSSFRRHQSSAINVEDAEPESSGDDAPELYSSPGGRRASRANTNKSYQEDDFVVLSSDDDIREIRPSNKSQNKKGKSKALKSAKEDSFIVRDNEEEEEEEDAEEEVPIRKKRLRRERQLTEIEKEDLDEDLKDLRSSPPSDHGRTKRKADTRKDALAALKRRRAGLEEAQSSPSRSASSARQPLVIESSEEEEEEQEEVLLDIDDEGFYEAPTDARGRGTLDGEDDGDDFVVDDDEDEPMGIPDDLDIDLPIYLTGVTRMKPKELFRYAVEWMVQKKLNPAYSMDKEKYDITFQRLDDEVRGLAGSKFTSSAWTRDFTISLQARPGIEVMELSSFQSQLLDKCQACNRSGHPATFRIEFTGKPYDPRTLEPLEQDGDDEDSDEDNDAENSEDEREEYDHKDRLVPSEKRAYSVGRFCKDNAMTAHALEHWKFQLNCWIVEWLDAEGHLTNELIVKRDRWDEPKRRKYARKVVKEMEEVGQIKQLHRQFRDEIDSARERKSAWQRGGGEEY